MALPTVEVETPSPKCSSKTWRCSSRVRSSLASRCLGSHSLSIAPFLEGLPGIGPGSTSPVSRRLFIQRFMVGIDTEKVLATSSLGVPASTAASTLNLRSFEYGFMPGGYHIWIDTYGCRCERSRCTEHGVSGNSALGKECARPTGGRHGRTTNAAAQRFNGANLRATLEVG